VDANSDGADGAMPRFAGVLGVPGTPPEPTPARPGVPGGFRAFSATKPLPSRVSSCSSSTCLGPSKPSPLVSCAVPGVSGSAYLPLFLAYAYGGINAGDR